MTARLYLVVGIWKLLNKDYEAIFPIVRFLDKKTVQVLQLCSTFSGMDGAVYEWDTFTGKRVGESVLKSCSYTSVAITPDGKTTFAVGSDKTLKEVADSQVWHVKFYRT